MAKSNISQHVFRQWLIVAVVCAVTCASVFWIVWHMRANAGGDPKPAIYLYCTKCLSVYEPASRLGGEHPRECDNCHEKAAWYAMQCNDCGEVFPFAPETSSQGEVIRKLPLCPRCRNGNYGMYNPKMKSAKEQYEE